MILQVISVKNKTIGKLGNKPAFGCYIQCLLSLPRKQTKVMMVFATIQISLCHYLQAYSMNFFKVPSSSVQDQLR